MIGQEGVVMLTKLWILAIWMTVLTAGCSDQLESDTFQCPAPELVLTPECNQDPSCIQFRNSAMVDIVNVPDSGECQACVGWLQVQRPIPVLTSAGPTGADCTYVYESRDQCQTWSGMLCQRIVDVTYQNKATAN